MKRKHPKRKIETWDIEELTELGKRYLFTLQDVQAIRGGISRRTAYSHIERWIELRLVVRRSGYLLLTRDGLSLTGLPYQFHKFKEINFPHWADVNAVERYLRGRDDITLINWIGEREIRHNLGIRDEFEDYRGGEHIPDAIAEVLIRESGEMKPIAIEVERTQKSQARLERILSSLAAHYDHVWYFASPSAYRAVEACLKMLTNSQTEFGLWHLERVTGEQHSRPTTTFA